MIANARWPSLCELGESCTVPGKQRPHDVGTLAKAGVAQSRKATSAPGVSCPSSTRRPPCQSTITTPVKVEKVSTAKKIATITHSILPAGSTNVAVIAIQNLIIPDGFVSRIVDGRRLRSNST